MYAKIRTIHLLLGLFSLGFLLMYGVSAVQMAHSKWFPMKPRVESRQVQLRAGIGDGRVVARELALRGEIMQVEPAPSGFKIRIAIPGTVHEIDYARATGVATLRTSVAPLLGMLNRLHHAAGLWHELPLLKAWGVAVGLISIALLGIGATGLYMWFVRRQERLAGAILLALNVAFAITVLTLLRAHGP